jgi:hypothetical protein
MRLSWSGTSFGILKCESELKELIEDLTLMGSEGLLSKTLKSLKQGDIEGISIREG